jgi:hypothetical protein
MFRSLLFVSIFAGLMAASCHAQQSDQPSAALVSGPDGSNSSTTASIAKPNEDWTKLKVDRSVLKPLLNGAPLGKMETPSYSRELVRMEWRRGDPIDMYIVKPHGVEKPRVVLYLYSFPSDIDRFMDDGWCQRATRQGLAAVGFVSALTGDRFRNRPMREWFIPQLQEALGSSVHDVQLILDYLGNRPDLSANQVGMWGQGSGGTIAILAAVADPRIRALDLLNPWGDWPDWLKTSPVVPEEQRASFLTPEFLRSVSMLDPVSYLPLLQDRSVHLQQIVDDPAMPPAARDKMAAAVPQDRLAQFKNAEAHRDVWKTTGLSGWIATQFSVAPLQPASGAASNLKQSQP